MDYYDPKKKLVYEPYLHLKKPMPKNKNASFRYRVIDQCLRNTARKWSLRDLIDKISDELYEQFGHEEGVSKRTVQMDLNIMRSDPPRGFGAPIEVKDGSYFYSDPEFSINQNPLNETDIENLKEAADILRHFRGLPVYSEIENMIGKIQQDIFTAQKDVLIDFEKVEELKNIELLGELYPLLKNKQVLELDYQPFKKEKQEKIQLHPYLLKEYNNRWFLMGWNEVFSDFTVLAIDRIIEYKDLNKSFIGDFKSKLKELLSHIVGVSIPKEKKVEEIELEVFSVSVPYFLTKPLHPSQTVKTRDENSAIFYFKLIPNYELEQIILSFGENCIVKKPEYFKEHIKGRILELSKNY